MDGLMSKEFYLQWSQEDRATEVLWQNSLRNLTALGNEVILPLNVVDKIGYDNVDEISRRLSALLNQEVDRIVDDSISALRIMPQVTRQQPIKLMDREYLSTKIHQASSRGHLSIRPRKIPRPPNSFILYRQHHHQAVKANNPGVANTEVSRIIASMWRDESSETRAHFKKLAEEMKQQHAIDYPDYQYTPRRPEEIRRRETRRSTTVPAWTVEFLRGTPKGDALLATAVRGRIKINDDFMDCLSETTTLLDGPNTLAPVCSPSCPEVSVQDAECNPAETVRWSPLDGTEFDPDFPMAELLELN